MTSDPATPSDPSSDAALGSADASGEEVNDVLPMPQDPDDSLQSGDGVTGETSD